MTDARPLDRLQRLEIENELLRWVISLDAFDARERIWKLLASDQLVLTAERELVVVERRRDAPSLPPNGMLTQTPDGQWWRVTWARAPQAVMRHADNTGTTATKTLIGEQAGDAPSPPAPPRYATDEQVRESAERMMEKHRGTLERLAEHDRSDVPSGLATSCPTHSLWYAEGAGCPLCSKDKP